MTGRNASQTDPTPPIPKGLSLGKSLLVLLSLLLPFLLLLQNGHWRPGNDSDLYLTIARNLATGQGYTFNGLPVGKLTPLWPATLA